MHVACAIFVIALGCDRVDVEKIDELVEPLDHAAGSATTAAIDAFSTSAAIARRIAATPGPFCRAPIPDRGPVTVVTELEYLVKRPDGAHRTIERRSWTRDAADDIASRVEIDQPTPDSRRVTTSWETRRVDGNYYRAIDDRFVRADDIPSVDRPLSRRGRDAVDSLLSLARRDGATLHPATSGRALCPMPETAAAMEYDALGTIAAFDEASVRFEGYRRRGWMRWSLPGGDGWILVRFDERQRAEADDVVVPETLWETRADRSYEVVTSFVERGIEEGWLVRE